MSYPKSCAAYDKGKGICKNGFPLHPLCIGLSEHKCYSCGQKLKSKPACMNEHRAAYVADYKAPYPTRQQMRLTDHAALSIKLMQNRKRKPNNEK